MFVVGNCHPRPSVESGERVALSSLVAEDPGVLFTRKKHGARSVDPCDTDRGCRAY